MVFALSLCAVAHADNSAKAVFEEMKKLAGTWTGVEAGQTYKVVYRVTGGGSALVETQFPGSEHEMVTVYHMDGKQLMMTHYCAAGNQPTMRYVPGRTPNSFDFKFVRGTNMTLKDMYMHSVNIRIAGKDKLVEKWSNYNNGKPMASMTFELSRAKE